VKELGASPAQIKAFAERIIKTRGMSFAVELSNYIVELYNATVQTDEETEADEAQAA
jgi:hypothetical protein